MYRSPSVFMAHAEIAAGSFANKFLKTQNSALGSPGTNKLEEDEDTVVIQQISNRSFKPKKRVTTANYIGSK